MLALNANLGWVKFDEDPPLCGNSWWVFVGLDHTLQFTSLQGSFKFAKQGQACWIFFFKGGFVISFNLSFPSHKPASE